MDPNATYKQGFQELTTRLGRLPLSSDPEWLELHARYSAHYSDIRDMRVAEERKARQETKSESNLSLRRRAPEDISPLGIVAVAEMAGTASFAPITSAAGPGDTGFSRKPAPGAIGVKRAREGGDGALSGPGAIPEPARALAEPEPSRVNPGAAEGPIVGSRGPGGGIVAECVQCGRAWERPARRGRPASKCGECR